MRKYPVSLELYNETNFPAEYEYVDAQDTSLAYADIEYDTLNLQ